MTALSRSEQIDWLRLARADNVGPVTFAHLLERYGTATRALAALPRMKAKGVGAVSHVPTIVDAERELAAGEAIGAELLASIDDSFPKLLSAMDPPPPLLWILGDAHLLSRRAVAIVGARIASAAGQRFARSLAAELGQAGFVVVSGMARGIDAAAHDGALPSGTVAVLAGGVGDIYPPEHRDLHAEIARLGCVVSERPIGHNARAADFPRRNRIISGLSMGVVVVEAELKSGSLITARLANEQGREVFAVPGSPMDPRSRGTNDLLRQGATLVEDAADVIRVLDAQTSVAAPRAPAMEWAAERDDEIATPMLETIRGLLSPSPTALDELARAAGTPMPEVLAAVVELSLAGRADVLSGGMVVARSTPPPRLSRSSSPLTVAGADPHV
jgi:DNA processing protein